MNLAHLHLTLNHVPMIGIAFGVLALLYGLWRKSCEVVRVSFLLFFAAALVAVPVYLTGEPAKVVAKGTCSFVRANVEPHEEAATFALISSIVTGLVAAVGLYLLAKKKTCKPQITITVLAFALVSVLLMSRTALLGGRINHQELRSGYVAPPRTVEDND